MKQSIKQLCAMAATACLAGGLLYAIDAAPVLAQSTNQIITGARESNNQSVQIEADSMEINQEQQRATFTGNVDAVQGSVSIQSDQLFVEYEELPDGDGTKTDVTFLDARGNVTVVSGGQTVRAQWARMDVRANTVLFGDDVTVSDGRTEIRGKKLEMNLNTGESRLTGGRVQGTFFQSGN